MTFARIFQALAMGIGYTVLVTLVCFSTGLIIGLATALMSRLRRRPLDLAILTFTYVFRGVPVLVLLFIVFFGLPMVGIRVSSIVSMILSLGFISGAYLSEIFRGAMNAIGEDEITAARAMGMTTVQIFFYIEFPQMFRFSIPGMVNEFTSVLKYSPFAYTVGIPEIMKEAMSLTAVTLRGLEIYVAVGIMYFAIYRAFRTLFTIVARKYEVPGLSAD